MSIGIIRKIEFRLLEDPDFAEFSFTGFSGTIRKETSRQNGNVLHTTTISLRAPEITGEKTAQLDALLYRRAQYRVTDGNGRIHLVGDNAYPARLTYEQGIDGHPGSRNGYSISILHLSPESYPIT